MFDQLDISPQAEQALQRLQDTNLSPMEEALFKSWTKANQIEDPDAPGDTVDYRGIWKQSNGLVLPHGELKKMTEGMNLENSLQQALQQRMIERIQEVTGKQEDMQKSMFDAKRQDIKHNQTMEQGQLELKQAPFNLKMKEHDIKGKELGLEQKRLGLDSQKLGNKAKEMDLIMSLMSPAPAMQPVGTNATGQTSRSSDK